MAFGVLAGPALASGRLLAAQSVASRLGLPDSTQTAFRREIRGPWFGWLAAHEEGDLQSARAKLDDIIKYARRVGIKRLSDMALAATLVARRDIAAGKWDVAREALTAAVTLDPDLPEARWIELTLSYKTKSWGQLPGKYVAAVRATLRDEESKKVFFTRLALVGAVSAAAIGLILILLVGLTYFRRYLHDVSETTGRFVSGPAQMVLTAAITVAPFLLALDVIWYLLILFAVTFGYATRKQRILSGAGVALMLPLFPVMDRTSYELSIMTSPVLRGAQALAEARYDQRVLDDLEATKNVLPDDVDIRFLLGRLYQSLGQNDRAVAEYSIGIQTSKAEVRCLVNRGGIRYTDGDFGSAQEDFLEALKRDGRNVAARYNLSLVYAETFRTVEAAESLKEARALDLSAVEAFQSRPGLVKIGLLDYSMEEARKKVVALERDSRSRRLPGHYRSHEQTVFPNMGILFGLLLVIPAGIGLDRLRSKGRGYSQECQKCNRTFCRLCKPPGEGALLCSQCVHVYLKKDGVSIETKMQKADDVRHRLQRRERFHLLLNILLPGSAAFLHDRPVWAAISLGLFVSGVVAIVGWGHWIVSLRPGLTPSISTYVLPAIMAATGFVMGQLSVRKS
ncbi:MAG: tetratricopeptide repeat protein [Acidobacteria bacterium]|nr:tetratricopeptide repeat protein [Acidobacteriota bacterium]MCK6683955.1 tetratricopeptide repeat protein [Thermoanaerobaculia bacterium]